MFTIIRSRLAVGAFFMISTLALITAFVTGLLFSATPLHAAPRAQTSLPDFVLNANSVLTVTVAVTDGQVIVVPVDLTFITQHEDGETEVSMITDVEQQVGIFIGVVPSTEISATIQLPGAAVTTDAEPGAANTNRSGTHVANVNSNLRAGPGTNFQIVGRVPAGDTVTIVGQNNAGTWLQLDNGAWIAEFLVEPIEDNNQNNDGDSGDEQDQNNSDNDADEEDEEQANEESEISPVSLPAESPESDSAPAALADYLLEVTAIGSQASQAVDTLNDLIQNPQPLSAEWRSSIGVQLSVLSGALDQYLALTPVPGYEDLHTEVTSVALTCEQAVDYLAAGVNNPQVIDPALAIQSVQACSAQAAGLAAYIDTYR